MAMEEMWEMVMDDEELGSGVVLMSLLTWVLLPSGPDWVIAPLRIPMLVLARGP